MCGRYVLYGPDSRLIDAFELRELPPFVPRYNVAPQSDVLVIREGRDRVRVGELVDRRGQDQADDEHEHAADVGGLDAEEAEHGEG